MKVLLTPFLTLFIAITFLVPMPAESRTVTWTYGSANGDFVDEASSILEKHLAGSKAPFLKKLYGELFYVPVWVADNGLTQFGNELLQTIERDTTLTVTMESRVHYTKLIEALEVMKSKRGGSLQEKIELELALSRLYKSYAEYLIYGGINWKAFQRKLKSLKKSRGIDAGWEKYKPTKSPTSVLLNAVINGNLTTALREAEPIGFKYAELKKYLKRYITIAKRGTWKKLPKSSKGIKSGGSGKVIPMIRNNLAILGDLGSCRDDMGSQKYDACLEKAVTRFQIRHGLKPDGAIGSNTYKMLSLTPAKKIRLMRLNLDRIKWLRTGQSKINMQLNIPSFRLHYYDGKELVDTMRVVVGKIKNATPSFGHLVEYIVVNPWWKIPESIVQKEMLGNLIKDPYHYERQGKVLRKTWDEHSERIDPGTIDWEEYRGRSIPFRFMQVPSRRNALGKIKFVFPNKFAVYIHDTPSKKLFFRTNRAFSHGCMRIQKPRELLKAFAMYNDNIDVEAIMERLQGTEKKILHLKTKVPIDITYLTAFVDDYGNLNFRNDIYRYDRFAFKDYRYKPENIAVDPTLANDELAPIASMVSETKLKTVEEKKIATEKKPEPVLVKAESPKRESNTSLPKESKSLANAKSEENVTIVSSPEENQSDFSTVPFGSSYQITNPYEVLEVY